MSRSSFSKAYEEIRNFKPTEMTFTINDADLDKLSEILKDINVKECPWFEIQDKHGNKAKYYRESRWIPCSERLPEEDECVLVTDDYDCIRHCIFCKRNETWRGFVTYEEGMTIDAIAWQPLPSPFQEEQ